MENVVFWDTEPSSLVEITAFAEELIPTHSGLDLKRGKCKDLLFSHLPYFSALKMQALRIVGKLLLDYKALLTIR
jgi:hypothetical protein